MRVAAGAIAKKYLKDEFGVEIRAYLSQMGDVSIDKVDWDEIENNAFFCPDADKVEAFDQLIRDLKKRRRLNWCENSGCCNQRTCWPW